MVLAVHQEHAHVDDRVPGQDAFLQRFAHAFFHRDDKLVWDRPATDLVHKFKPGTPGQRLDVDETDAVLPVTAGLLHVPSLRLGFGPDRLPVRHPRSPEHHVDAELPAEPVGGDLQVRLAHPGDDGLLHLRRAVDAQRRILLHQPLQRDPHFVLIAFAFRLHRQGDDRLRKLDRGQQQRGLFG